MRAPSVTTSKLTYFMDRIGYFYRPNFWRGYNDRKDCDALSVEQLEIVENRVKLLNKLSESFSLSDQKITLSEIVLKKQTAYKLDIAKELMGYTREKAFDALWGDVTHVPDTPSFVKSRPIVEGNENSVLLKLNVPRHYPIYKDFYKWNDKNDLVLYRGGGNNKDRKLVVKKYSDHPAMDVKLASKRRAYQENFMRPEDQLASKFIISVEGVDVATNLKWIMASNSLCVMKKPKMESWFLESQLIPGKHYIEVDDGFTNLEEVVQPYLDDPDLAAEMNQAGWDYMQFLFNPRMERLTSYLVAQKYFELVMP